MDIDGVSGSDGVYVKDVTDFAFEWEVMSVSIGNFILI